MADEFGPVEPVSAGHPLDDFGAVEPITSRTSTAIHHGLQGLTSGVSDELGGLGTAGLQAIANNLPDAVREKLGLVKADPMEAYRYSRDEERKLLAKQEAEHPELATASKLAGGVALGAALPVARVGSGVAGAVGSGALTGAGYGALAGLGTSNADLTKGETDQALADTLRGGVMGGAMGAGGGLLAAGAHKVAGFASGKVQAGLDKANQMAQDAIEEQIGTLRGKLGAETQKGSRQIENILRAVQSGEATPEQMGQIQALKDSGKWGELVKGVTQRNLEELPGQMEAIQKAKDAFGELAEGKGQAIANKAAEIASPAEAGRQVLARVARYGPVVAGGVVGKALHAVDSPGPGFLAGAGIRPALRAVARAATHPSVQVPVFRAMGKVGELLEANPQALGKYGGALTSIAEQRGPEAAAAAHFVLQQTDPEYQRLAQADSN